MSYNYVVVVYVIYARGDRLGEVVPVVNQRELLEDAAVCDGRALKCEDYPEFYALMGNTYSPPKYIKRKLSLWEKIKSLFVEVNETEINPKYKQGYFNIPDLCGRW